MTRYWPISLSAQAARNVLGRKCFSTLCISSSYWHVCTGFEEANEVADPGLYQLLYLSKFTRSCKKTQINYLRIIDRTKQSNWCFKAKGTTAELFSNFRFA